MLSIGLLVSIASLNSCQDPSVAPSRVQVLPNKTPHSHPTVYPTLPNPEVSQSVVNTNAADFKSLCEASVQSLNGVDEKTTCSSISNPNVRHLCNATILNTFSDQAIHECKQIDEQGSDYYNLCMALVNSHGKVQISKGYCERILTADLASLCFAWSFGHDENYNPKQLCLTIKDPILAAFCDANVPELGHKENLSSCEQIPMKAEPAHFISLPMSKPQN